MRNSETRSFVGAFGKFGPLRGALMMIASGACLSGMLATVRYFSHELPTAEMIFFRYLFGAIMMLPWLLLTHAQLPRTQRLGRHLFRAASGLAAMASLFFAVQLMPLADATALSFTAPIFAIIGSAFVLREKVTVWRWIATLFGISGAIIILKPIGMFNIAAIVPIAAAVFAAAATLTVKSLSRTDSPATIVFYFTALVMPLAFVLALPGWQTPLPSHWPWLAWIAALATASQILLTLALREGDASFILPFDYCQLIVASVLGYALYTEIPALSTLAGAALIMAGAVSAILTERASHAAKPGQRLVVGRERAPADAPGTSAARLSRAAPPR